MALCTFHGLSFFYCFMPSRIAGVLPAFSLHPPSHIWTIPHTPCMHAWCCFSPPPLPPIRSRVISGRALECVCVNQVTWCGVLCCTHALCVQQSCNVSRYMLPPHHHPIATKHSHTNQLTAAASPCPPLARPRRPPPPLPPLQAQRGLLPFTWPAGPLPSSGQAGPQAPRGGAWPAPPPLPLPAPPYPALLLAAR